jgi:hypothetical protein
MKTPVLFVIFNRPEPAAQVFAAIREARPERLYIAADGPRPDRPDDVARCAQTLRVVEQIDWPCTVRTLYRTSNLGCRHAVSSAITWFFECEPEGIILEDDCLPSRSFFRFCSELLDRYRDNPEVMCIAGSNFLRTEFTPTNNYYFSGLAPCWGWASWARAWKTYDVDMRDWPRVRESSLLRDLFPESWSVRAYWKEILDCTHEGIIDTWDYQWMLTCWKSRGLTCLPDRNLVRNIGFGADATHTTGNSWLGELDSEELDFPLSHPRDLERNRLADGIHIRHFYPVRPHAVAWLIAKRAFRDRHPLAFEAYKALRRLRPKYPT